MAEATSSSESVWWLHLHDRHAAGRFPRLHHHNIASQIGFRPGRVAILAAAIAVKPNCWQDEPARMTRRGEC